MDTECMIDFLEKDNARMRQNLRLRKYHYIQQNRFLLKPLINKFRQRPDIIERINALKIENELEQKLFLKHKEQIERLATIDLSKISSSILLTIIKRSTEGTYDQGFPVQFIAHCKMVYAGKKYPMAMVSDPYANIPVCFPYHLMEELPVIPGEYYLFHALIKSGDFLVMGVSALDI